MWAHVCYERPRTNLALGCFDVADHGGQFGLDEDNQRRADQLSNDAVSLQGGNLYAQIPARFAKVNSRPFCPAVVRAFRGFCSPIYVYQ